VEFYILNTFLKFPHTTEHHVFYCIENIKFAHIVSIQDTMNKQLA